MTASASKTKANSRDERQAASAASHIVWCDDCSGEATMTRSEFTPDSARTYLDQVQLFNHPGIARLRSRDPFVRSNTSSTQDQHRRPAASILHSDGSIAAGARHVEAHNVD